MRKREPPPPPELAAKWLLIWIGLHFLLYLLLFHQNARTPCILALGAYGLCLLRLDWALYRGGSPEDLRGMWRYWLTACVCMGLWLLWAEPKLAGSNGVMETMLVGLVVPYGPHLSGDWGWTERLRGAGLLSREAILGLQWGLVGLCAGHLAYYLWLSRRRR